MANFALVRLRFLLLIAVATLFTLCLATTRASADDASRFRDLVKQATEAFGRGDFQRAVELCDEAYAIKPNPRLLYNRARAHEALGNAERAISDYEQYLEREPATEDRGIITGRIKALRAQLAERERLAGERAQSASRRTEARAHYRRYLELLPNAADRKEIEKRLWELDHPSKQRPSSPDREPRETSGAGPLPWITLTVGGVVLAGGGVFALLSRQKYDDAKSASSGEKAGQLRDDADRLTTFANVGFVVGGVALVSGVTWLLLSPSSSRSAKLRARVGDTAVLR